MYDINKPLSKTSGITVIEMMVVLVIMTIIFSLGFANFRNYSQKQILYQAKRQVEGDMNLAKEYALAGKKPEAGCVPLDGYRWTYKDTTAYSVFADCGTSTNVSIGKDLVTLPSGISMTVNDQSNPPPTVPPIPVDNSVLFKVLGHGTEGGTFTVVLTHDRLGISTTITR